MSWNFYPEDRFSSYDDYIKYLKEMGFALEAPEGMHKEDQTMRIIKTLGDFRKLTKDLGDDFEIEFRVRTRVPEEELKNRTYPYPYDTEYFEGFEFDDVGYSDKVACFGVTMPE